MPDAKQPCFCTCCRQAQFERDQKALAAQRSETPTDSARIAAAIAALSPCMAVISKSEPYPSKDFFLNQQITKALAILEGRDQ